MTGDLLILFLLGGVTIFAWGFLCGASYAGMPIAQSIAHTLGSLVRGRGKAKAECYGVYIPHEATEMRAMCQCGENMICPICGYGWGSIPCSCSERRIYYDGHDIVTVEEKS